MFRKIRPKGSKERAEILVAIPLKRIGQSKEVAPAIAFLLFVDAAFITS